MCSFFALSLGIVILRFIRIVAGRNSLFFLLLSSILLHEYSTIFLSIFQLKGLGLFPNFGYYK